MIPKISNRQDKKTFTSLYYTQELKNGEKIFKKISAKAEAKWLDVFLDSSVHGELKYLGTDKEGHHYKTKIGETIHWDTLDEVDYFCLSSKDGKHRITGINDCEAKEGEDYIDVIEYHFKKLAKIFNPE